MNYQEPIQAQPKISEGAGPVPDASGPGPAFVARSATGGTEYATGWRYANGTHKRDLRLDAIRGIAVLVMLINHLGGDESWLYALTGNDNFFISAAEPFVFISGMVMGIAYARVIRGQGILPAVTKALRRVLLLYALTVGVGLVFALTSLQFDLPWAPHWTADGLGDFVLSIVTLQRTYYLTDILLLYTLLVAAAVPALLLLARGYWWVVLGGTWALWGAWQRWPHRFDLPWHIADNDIFHFAPWQVLFFTALVIGYHRSSVERLLAKGWSMPARAAERIKLRRSGRIRAVVSHSALAPTVLVVTGIVVVSAILLYQWVRYTPGSLDDLTLARMFEKAGMRPGRLVAFVPFMLFAFALLTVAWQPIKAAAGWLLLPLGQSALPAFTLHLFVAALVVKLQTAIGAVFPGIGDVQANAAMSTLLQVAGIGLVWGFIKLKEWIGVVLGSTERVQEAGAARPKRYIPRKIKIARIMLPAGGLVLVLIVAVVSRGPVARTLQELNDKGQHTFVPVATTTARVPVRAAVATVTTTATMLTVSEAPITPTQETIVATFTEDGDADAVGSALNEVMEDTSGQVYSAVLDDPQPDAEATQISADHSPTPTVLVPSTEVPPFEKADQVTSTPVTLATLAPVYASPTESTQSTNAPTSTPEGVLSAIPTTGPTSPASIATPTIVMSEGVEVHSFASEALGRTMEYVIYLPPGYYADGEKRAQRYPVAYMLHGMDSSAGQWAGYGMLKEADRMMRSGEIQSFIIVLPQGDGSYWFDHASGGPRWGTYLVHDVVGEIDAAYRTIADRDHRAIGGLSMGGHAALELSINFPDVFGIAGAHSPSLHSHETAPAFFGDESYFRTRDPKSLYSGMPEVARTIKLWIDLGEQDAWLPVVEGFHRTLDNFNIPHEWHVYPGGHIGEYWSTHSPDYLRFYDTAFGNLMP